MSDLPQNAVRAATHMVSAHGVSELVIQLLKDINVIRVEVERVGANYRITVRYAIMDIQLQLNMQASEIEKLVLAANGGVRLPS